MDYLLDTNIVINLLRDSTLSKQIRSDYSLFQPSQRLFISVVVEGELESLSLQNLWGSARIKELRSFLEYFIVCDIRVQSIIQRYAEIDAFSQGKLQNYPLERV